MWTVKLMATNFHLNGVLHLSHLTEHPDVLMLLPSTPFYFFLASKSLPRLAGHVTAHAEAGLVRVNTAWVAGNCWSYCLALNRDINHHVSIIRHICRNLYLHTIYFKVLSGMKSFWKTRSTDDNWRCCHANIIYLGNQKKIEVGGLRIEIGAYQKLLRGKKAKPMLAWKALFYVVQVRQNSWIDIYDFWVFFTSVSKQIHSSPTKVTINLVENIWCIQLPPPLFLIFSFQQIYYLFNCLDLLFVDFKFDTVSGIIMF